MPEFVKQASAIDIAGKLGSHEKQAIVVIDEFVVFCDVERLRKEDAGDLVNEPGTIRARDQQNVGDGRIGHLLYIGQRRRSRNGNPCD